MGLTIASVSHDDSELTRASLSWTNTLDSDPDTLSFLLNPGTAKPDLGSEVSYTLPTGEKLFGGRITGYPEMPSAFKMMGYQVSCSDWRSDADRRILNDRFVNLTSGAIVAKLFAKYAPEFDTSLVDQVNGPTIAAIKFGRNVRLTGAMDRLAKLTGFVWDITPDQEVVWREPTTSLAPFSLTDTSKNFHGLEIDYNRDQLANKVTVRGGRYQGTTATTDLFDGDGVRTLFRLSKLPFTADQYVVFEDGFGSLDASKWLETDVTNGSPAAGHIASDGYLYTTIQDGAALVESGYLQIVGGDGTWGHVRLMSFDPIGRGDGARRFELDVYAENATGDGRFGLWDPNDQSTLTGEQHGIYFDSGTLRVSEAGSNVGSTMAYTAASWTRIRIVPGASSGALVYAQTGANFATRNWTLLHTSSTGSLANFTFSACFNKDFIGRVDRARVFNRLLDATLTVGGVEKTCGLYGTDEDAGVDALIKATYGEPPLLAFFSDTLPASGTRNVSLVYYEGFPVLTVLQDNTSIADIAAIEGNAGVYEGYVEDSTLDSMDLARARAQQELDQYANPLVTIKFTTNTIIEPTVKDLRAGQLITVTLTGALSGRDIDGQYLVQQVDAKPAGNSAGAVAHEFTVTATARLRRSSDYILELLKLSKKGGEAEDPNEILEELVYYSDTMAFTDSTVIEEGDLGPYVYGGIIGTEAGDDLITEGGDALNYEPAARYGMATYS